MLLETPSILITDDDRDFRETLREVFEPRGFRTWLAADGDEAIEIVRNEQVHLTLLDMHMPRLSGLEALRQIKRIHAIVPCILISAEMDEALAEAARRADAFSVHSKPIRLAELTGTISRAMRQIYDWPDVI